MLDPLSSGSSDDATMPNKGSGQQSVDNHGLLVACSPDGSVRVWQTITGSCVGFVKHHSGVACVHTACGRIWTGHGDGNVCVVSMD